MSTIRSYGAAKIRQAPICSVGNLKLAIPTRTSLEFPPPSMEVISTNNWNGGIPEVKFRGEGSIERAELI